MRKYLLLIASLSLHISACSYQSKNTEEIPNRNTISLSNKFIWTCVDNGVPTENQEDTYSIKPQMADFDFLPQILTHPPHGEVYHQPGINPMYLIHTSEYFENEQWIFQYSQEDVQAINEISCDYTIKDESNELTSQVYTVHHKTFGLNGKLKNCSVFLREIKDGELAIGWNYRPKNRKEYIFDRMICELK